MVKDDCIFCKIGKGEIPSTTIYESEEFKCFFDVAPAHRGHALIIPKNHYDNVFEIEEETAGKLFRLATRIAPALKAVTGCEGMNLVQNNGTVAGQTVHHFHLHLIPRDAGDGINLTWPQGKADPEETKALAEEVKKQISE